MQQRRQLIPHAPWSVVTAFSGAQSAVSTPVCGMFKDMTGMLAQKGCHCTSFDNLANGSRKLQRKQTI
eukprot:4763411-Amphidinium_carterae.2